MNTHPRSFRILLAYVATVLCLSLVFLAMAQAEVASKPRASTAHDSPSGALHRVLETGTLRVGIALFTPWTFKNKDGELAGFEIDIARQLAKDLGVKPEFHSFKWENIIPALLKGEIDIIAAGMVITPQRALKVNFSQPYDSSGIGLVTNIPLTKAFDGPEDLNQSEVIISAVTGSIGEDLAHRVFPAATIKTFSSSQEAIQAVTGGKVHGYIEHEPITTFIALDHPDTVDEPLSKPLLETKEGFAVRKGDPDFIHFLNAWIISHNADTWLRSVHEYWFEGIKWRKDVVATNP
ncbi:MAG: transporter substrate-binding domain-containing protein [Nitrospira sp.]|nr:transporter substrate-binding domain-containing protein [Nitrospira sp.]